MRYEKQIRIVSLLMLCAMLAGICQPASAAVKAERILKRMENLTQIPGTHYLLAQESKNKKWGVYDTDANIVIPLEYEKLSYLAYDVLMAGAVPAPEEPYEAKKSIPLETINCNALMTLDGKVHTEYAYGVFKVFSPQWCAGWVLEEGNAEDSDYTPDKQHYFRIGRCDVFFRNMGNSSESGENSFCQVLSMTRDEYRNAKAHGEYLSVQNRENGITVLNQQGGTVDIDAKNLDSSVYGIKNWMLVNLVTGEMLMDGCSAVSEVQTEDELLLIATRIDFQGRKQNALITTEGEVILPMSNAAISSVSRDYAVITSNDHGKKGLYSFKENRMLLPCEYDEIHENKNSVDRFNNHGYIVVTKDGQYCCYEVATDRLLPVVQAEEDKKLERNGAAFYTTTKVSKTTRTQLYSPDGKELSLLASITKSHGSGYLLIANFSYGTTVINWYGNNYLPQYYSRIIITDDDHFILNTKKSGYELYRIPE